MIRLVSISLLAIMGAAPASSQQPQPIKRRLAVYEFDYSAVMNYTQAIFGTSVNIGRGISALMVKRLTDTSAFTVLERSKIDILLREQDFGAGSRTQQATGARVGRIQGADLLLTGDITTFGFDDKSLGVKGGGVGGTIGKGVDVIGGVFHKKENKAVVVINYRLVDVETSQNLLAGEARGESVRKSKGFGGLFAGGGALGGAGVDMTSSNFRETIIGEATADCVNKLAENLNAKAATLPARKIDINARVADVTGSVLIITAGANAGVRVGDKFEIARIQKEIRDPVTKEVLDMLTDKVGELEITAVKDNIAVGNYTGSVEAKVGDAAKKM